MYIHRHLEAMLATASKMFGAVLVTGPRQVGKTTLVRRFASTSNYVTLDDPMQLHAAVEQPATFFKDNKPPVFVDEIQYAPNLFPYIKMKVDEENAKGLFYLSGSQQFKLMKNVGESLAGRLGILNLLGLSMREYHQLKFNDAFLPTEEYFAGRRKELKPLSYDELWRVIHRGSMPDLLLNDDFDWQIFYASYVKTYIERDVRELTQVGDEVKFITFMIAVASITGQLLNISSLAKNVGISVSTAERWLSILVTSNIVYLLRPYANNVLKRSVKTPKLYFLDTGLAAYLTKWTTADVLKNGAMAGAFFETFVVAEIIKSYYNKGIAEPPLYFYRDKEQKEIDLLIECNGVLYPLEMKKHADPKAADIKAFAVLDDIPGVQRGSGGVICTYHQLVTLKNNDKVIPISYI
ncbi:ATP-binding protein [uncultured Phascolarctobacterium sp.]|uniref:ATP-binding protein n=2 Tax=Phascolarctobacterium TaxID=33024 RepID=UPI0025D15E76|nr:ATP-binding protein [uncultured Phascolarctobacterium sp.]